MKTAIYAGTFDPITNGHLDVLHKSIKLFDKVILGVAEITGKSTTFSTEERFELCRQATADMPSVEVQIFDGLVVEFARRIHADVMIRGLRAISDFEYELSRALMNKKLYGAIETIFFVPEHQYLYLSSTMIREVVQLGGNVHDMIPSCVYQALKEKYKH
ncbi:MAG: pantetheine-phosphate adenylyltransferase [Candidatus Cloacimonetes bacterium]|nr:pantetheine-phosphate adenylyltransferase [Candidatus Cloacimonadota bacterium]